MQAESAVNVFNTDFILRLGSPLQAGQQTVSVLKLNGEAWSQVYVYDPADRILTPDAAKLEAILIPTFHKTGGVLNFGIVLADIVVGLVNGIVGILRGLLGGFVGFGFAGILIVLMLFVLGLYVALIGFLITAPILVISYGLRSYKDSLLRDGAAKMATAALKLVEEPVPQALPAA